MDINIVFDNVFEQIDGKKSLNKYVANFFDVLWKQTKKSELDNENLELDSKNLEPTVIPTPYGYVFNQLLKIIFYRKWPHRT